MVPGRDRTRDPWICSQTRICSHTRYQLRYAARSPYMGTPPTSPADPMVVNILPADPLHPPPPPRPLGWSQKVKFQIFTEHCHVEYHIKWNHECRNMVAFISLSLKIISYF